MAAAPPIVAASVMASDNQTDGPPAVLPRWRPPGDLSAGIGAREVTSLTRTDAHARAWASRRLAATDATGDKSIPRPTMVERMTVPDARRRLCCSRDVRSTPEDPLRPWASSGRMDSPIGQMLRGVTYALARRSGAGAPFLQARREARRTTRRRARGLELSSPRMPERRRPGARSSDRGGITPRRARALGDARNARRCCAWCRREQRSC